MALKNNVSLKITSLKSDLINQKKSNEEESSFKNIESKLLLLKKN